MAKEKQSSQGHEFFFRFMCGLLIFCFLVTVVSGVLNGVSLTGIIWRASIVVGVLLIIEFVLLKLILFWDKNTLQ